MVGIFANFHGGRAMLAMLILLLRRLLLLDIAIAD
jgi:hypothetical protein